MYVADTVSQMLGVPLDTLLYWQESLPRDHARQPRRRGRYSERDVRIFQAIARRVEAGASTDEALAAVHGRLSAGLTLDEPAGSLPPVGGADLGPLARSALAHAAAGRHDLLTRDVQEAWRRHGWEHVADAWICPVMRAAGDARSAGVLSLEGELAIVHALRAAILPWITGHRPRPGAPLILVGAAPGVQHDLGAMALVGLLGARGERAVLLRGAERPDVWRTTLATHCPAAIVLAATLEEDVAATDDCLALVARECPGALRFVGGRAARHTTGGIVLDTGIRDSADDVLEALSRRRPQPCEGRNRRQATSGE